MGVPCYSALATQRKPVSEAATVASSRDQSKPPGKISNRVRATRLSAANVNGGIGVEPNPSPCKMETLKSVLIAPLPKISRSNNW